MRKEEGEYLDTVTQEAHGKAKGRRVQKQRMNMYEHVCEPHANKLVWN